MTPRVVVIILNWNGLQDTLECLSSLQSVEYPNYEVVVVDNASTDGTVTAIREQHPQVIVIQNVTNLGFAEGNNVGIRYALDQLEAEYIVLLNNDTTVDPLWLHALVEVAQDPKVGAVGSLIYYYRDPKRFWFAGGTTNDWRGLPRHPKQEEIDENQIRQPLSVDYVSGCSILVPKHILQKVGLLDPLYFVYFEDTDWCARIQQAGYKIVLTPASRVWHKIGQSSGGEDSPLHIYYMQRNNVRFLMKKATSFQGRVKSIALYVLVSFKRYLPLLVSSSAHRRHIGSLAMKALRDAMLGRYGQYQGKL